MRITNIPPVALIAASISTTTASPIAFPKPSLSQNEQSPVSPGDTFILTALRSGSAIHYTSVSAALGHLFLKLPSQNATCDSDNDPSHPGPSPEYATFTLSKEGELYLYAKGVNEGGRGSGRRDGAEKKKEEEEEERRSQSSFPMQKLFGDRSLAGQGEVGYTTGTGIDGDGRRGPFTLNDHADLSFRGVGFLACPGAYDNAWSVWVDEHVWAEEDLPHNFDSSPLVGAPYGLKGCLGFVARAVKVKSHPRSCVYS